MIVEATIVFPVCLVIIIMLLYLGNVYYQKSRIEAIVVQAVLDGAAYCADPLLGEIETTHTVPAVDSVDYNPYRYIGGTFKGFISELLGGMTEIEDSVERLIKSRISGLDTGLYTGMKPGDYDVLVEYRSCFVASSICADVEYKIELPMRLLGERERISLKFRTHTEVPVSDSPEFIRNVNLVDDVLERTGAKEEIKKLKESFQKLFRK